MSLMTDIQGTPERIWALVKLLAQNANLSGVKAIELADGLDLAGEGRHKKPPLLKYQKNS